MLKLCIKTLVDMIGVIMNLETCVVKLGGKDLTIFKWTWLKTKTKIDIIFSMKTKRHTPNVVRKRQLFDKHKCCIQIKTEKI